MITKGANTRQMIVERSAELFNVHGYDGTSLSDIMKVTQLKKGGIYNHFQNKDEIALASFDFAFALVLQRFRERLDKDKTSLDKLYSIIDVFESFHHNPVIRGGCPVANTAVDATGNHPELKQKATEAVKRLHKYVQIKVEEGKESGEFKEEVDPNEVATLLLSTLEGALMMAKVLGSDEYVTTTSAYCKRYIAERLLRT